MSSWKISYIPYYMVSRMKWQAANPSEAIKVLAAAGYDGVEWMLHYHFNSTSELKRLVDETRGNHLQVSNIMCWEDLVTSNENSRTKSVATLKQYLSAAHEMAIPLMSVFTGPMTWIQNSAKIGDDISEEVAWAIVTDAFSEIVEAAEKNDVIVTVEAVFGMLAHDYYTMKEFLAYFDSKHLAVNLDPSHLALYGNDPSFAVRRFGKRIRHVHVKDSFGKPGTLGEDFEFPILGEGMVDWKRFFTCLREVDYEGYLSLEFENDTYLRNICNGDWTKVAIESKKRLHRFLDS
ncbi:MAG TPA: sugar phosphate isomerase/epimerase family protein [Candidatus Bathyarchaeia archaeon]|nr:sugar phosphate isomerase/epimerase family protein [Candidatus Bathyarchaeia archaeon]